MFTGIIDHIGYIVKRKNDAQDHDVCSFFSLEIKHTLVKPIQYGASIAINGVCLSVSKINQAANIFEVDVSSETISCTNLLTLKAGSRVHLEPSMCLGDEIGGHLIYGHVDDCCCLRKFEKLDGGHVLMQIEINPKWLAMLAPKGSVALNGVSLTINQINENVVSFNLIPQTLKQSLLGELKIGDMINMEIDPLMRYVSHMLSATKEMR
ncbi:MAG: riboflavin synthase [Pseudomonadota bacterium]